MIVVVVLGDVEAVVFGAGRGHRGRRVGVFPQHADPAAATRRR
ncbi:hypothetical protein [Nocardia sp. NPDC048505]